MGVKTRGRPICLAQAQGGILTDVPLCSQAIVEFWDSRGATTFHDQMNEKPFNGTPLDLKFIWDELPPGS